MKRFAGLLLFCPVFAAAQTLPKPMETAPGSSLQEPADRGEMDAPALERPKAGPSKATLPEVKIEQPEPKAPAADASKKRDEGILEKIGKTLGAVRKEAERFVTNPKATLRMWGFKAALKYYSIKSKVRKGLKELFGAGK